MKTPTEQELLGVQCCADADILKRKYSEWCALSPEGKNSSERSRHYKSQSNQELLFFTAFIISAAIYLFVLL